MKMKPIIEAGWNLQDLAENQERAHLGQMVAIGSHYCCAC